MSTGLARVLRVIPGAAPEPADASAPSGPAQRYAALLQRRREALQQRREHPTARDDADAPPETPGDAARDPLACAPAAPREDAAREAAPAPRARPPSRALPPAVVDVAAAPRALDAAHVRFARLAEFLLTRVAEFCGDDAVIAQGQWQIRMELDPALIPECTLHLTLSHFDLVLRFETRDAAARALISQHAGILKNRLDALLDAHKVTRSIEIISG